MTNDQKKPPVIYGQVLSPTHPARRELTVPPPPAGVVEAVFSGFFAGFATRSQAANNAYLKERNQSIALHTEKATELEALERQLARLDDLDNIIQEDQEQRDQSRAVARASRQREMREIDIAHRRLELEEYRLAQDLARAKQDLVQVQHGQRRQAAEHHREIIQDDHLGQRQLLENERVLQDARTEAVQAETRRLHQEMHRDFFLRRQKGTMNAEALAAERDELEAIKRLGDMFEQHKPDGNQTNEILELLIAQFEEQLSFVDQTNEARQAMVRLLASMKQMRQKKSTR